MGISRSSNKKRMELGKTVSNKLDCNGHIFINEVLRPSTVDKMDLSLRIYIYEFTWSPVDNSTTFNYEIR